MILDSIFSKTGFNLFGSLLGIGSGGLGGSAGGGGLPGMSEGGFTGMGGKLQPAGIVHAGEYVFDAESTKRAGLKNLARLHEILKSGRMPVNDNLPGYWNGGAVKIRMPNFDRGGFVDNLQGIDRMREASANGGFNLDIGLRFDDEGGLEPFVKKVTRKELETTGAAVMGRIHDNYRKNQLRADINTHMRDPRGKGTI
jgi:hypothetical protein